MSTHFPLSPSTECREADRPGNHTPLATYDKRENVRPPLQISCDCEDGWVWRPRRGGNDPDGRMERCEAPGCESGVIHLRCDTPRCVGYATAVEDGQYLCGHCAAHLRAEADLAAIEALTDWCRGREHAIPFGLLYTAVAAIERLRGVEAKEPR